MSQFRGALRFCSLNTMILSAENAWYNLCLIQYIDMYVCFEGKSTCYFPSYEGLHVWKLWGSEAPKNLTENH